MTIPAVIPAAAWTAEPREPCWAIADRIGELSTPPVPETALKRRDHHAEMKDLQRRLAVDFGKRHAWQLSDRPFTIHTLARGGIYDGEEVAGGYDPAFCDHPYWYRADRHARALVAHLYDAKDRLGEILTWAAARGLQASFPDYPSWWYPGQTMLVLYEPVILQAPKMRPEAGAPHQSGEEAGSMTPNAVKWALFDLLKSLDALHGGQYHEGFRHIAQDLGYACTKTWRTRTMSDAAKWGLFALLKALDIDQGGRLHAEFQRIAESLGLALPAIATPAPDPAPGREDEAVGEPSDPDILGRWIDACLDLSNPNATMPLADLFASWTAWTEREKKFTGTANAFSRALVRRWGEESKHHANTGVFFKGARLRDV